ncbi:MAG: PAS domain S-box protein [Janthinobacterium lividum]
MIGFQSHRRAVLAAFDRSQAMIEFDLNGRILTANQKFLDESGYQLHEIKGRHHRLFLRPGEHLTSAYRDFWDDLRRGHYRSAQYRRMGKGGREIWIQASYNPVIGWRGRPTRVIKVATNITEAKRRSLADDAKIQAIDRSQAVVEFALDGTILNANEHFCRALGYGIDELRGRHHKLLVDPQEQDSTDYARFWDSLRRGEYQQAEYRRIAKDGRDVWIQATYNPVLDSDGRPVTIVKFATDVTAAKQRSADDRGRIEAIHKSQAVAEFSIDGTVLSANENFLAIFGYAMNEIRGQHHRMFVSPEDQNTAAYRTFWDNLREGSFQTAEYHRVAKDGHAVWIQASYNPILGLRGEPIKVVKIATDITAEVARRHQVQLLSLVADETSNAVVITDSEGLTEYVNAGFTRMTGYDLDEMRGHRPGDILQGPDTSVLTRKTLGEQLAAQHPCGVEILNYTKTGTPHWVLLLINPVKDADGHVSRFISIQTDITERKRSQERLAFIAHHDPLTGLANRTLFQEQLRAAWDGRRPFTLLYLDLDLFKPVNDTLGHPAGDELLRQVAERLGDCIRADDSVARLGGDEFAVIYDGIVDEETVRILASGIVERISASFVIGFHSVTIGVSIGIASATNSDVDPQRLMKRADEALYAAKAAGRSTFRFSTPDNSLTDPARAAAAL